ncbi:ligand-binding sensor domain-containing diguanylate cyclase [Alteromonas sp. D210916BOD_24]|uniref:ligand-binding sensor domain-containing protein n=1 Tax=Alteromonas sp. D210916BOD_24 TaxID=3157618 RepID=UPI00399C6627
MLVPAKAAETPLELEQYKYKFKNFKHKGIKYTTTSLTQDEIGAIWIGTQNGLIRFDGYDKTIIKNISGNVNSLSSNYIGSLDVDNYGNIWVGTNNGLNIVNVSNSKVFRAGTYHKSLQPLDKGYINAIHSAPNGNIWIGTDDGLFIYFFDSSKLVKVKSHQNDPFALQENRIVGINTDEENYVLTEKSVYKIHDNFNAEKILSFEEKTGATTSLQAFLVTEDSIYLGTTNSGLYRYSLAEKSVFKSEKGPKDNDIRSIKKDKNGTIWVASTNGLLLFKKGEEEVLHLTMKNHQYRGLDTDYLTSVFVDKENLVWIGSHDTGVYLYSPNNSHIATIPVMGELIPGGARTIAMTVGKSDEVWLGGKEAIIKLDFQKGKMTAFSEPDEFKSSITYGLAFDHKRNKVYSTTKKGITIFDTVKKEFSSFIPFDKYKGAYGIHIDGQDQLWVGSNSSDGISVFNLITGALIKYIPAQRTYSFYEIEKYMMAFTTNGLYIINKDNFSLTVHKPGTKDNISHSSTTGGLIDSRGQFWVASSGGLNLHVGDSILENKYKHYSEADGFSSSVMTGPIEDEEHFLWIPTSRGLNRFSPTTGKVKVLGESQGAAESYFIGAYVKLQNGTLLFNGGQTGITAIEASQVFWGEGNYSPFISEIHSNIQNINEERKLALSVASSNFYSPEDMHYRYRLEGFDKEFTQVNSSRRNINYTNLPPGEYTLAIQASSYNSQWSEPIVYSFKISPYFYETNVFKFLIFGLFVGLFYFSYRIRLKMLKDSNQKLEAAVKKRTKKIQEQKLALENMAITDQLTGLNNRHFLEAHIETIWEQTKRRFSEDSQSGIAVYIVDLDHFKQVNDKYGHDVGDFVLKEFARLLKSVCRSSDYIIRWGGEEFIILSPYTNIIETKKLVVRITQVIRKHKFKYSDEQFISMTCSTGFYCYPGNEQSCGVTFSQALSYADEALYAIKNFSRDGWLGIEMINTPVENSSDLKVYFNNMEGLEEHSDVKFCSSI